MQEKNQCIFNKNQTIPTTQTIPIILTIKQMAQNIGVHPQTLKRWEREGKSQKPDRTLGNNRRYKITNIENKTLVVGYARVSSHDQKSDLARQENVISQTAKPDLIIKDRGSGLNYKKSGFKQLLFLLLQGKIKELVITHKDRLLRFGSEIIFQIANFVGTKITIINQLEDKPPMEQFCNDLVEIMTVFCSKIYGHR